VLSDLAPHALAPGTQIRDYTIVSVIGTGGFSIVYKAIDNSLDRAVAIKEYFPGAFALRDSEGSVRPHSRDVDTFSKGIESFLNEGKLLVVFDHPALVRVYRCWEERGTAYLAMRLYEGTTLRDAVKAGDWRTDEATLRALLLPICNALDVLHAANCYHRDVAPDNIMLVDAPSHAGARLAPVLLDFGAARKAIESTQVFTAILKPGYAPIEQYGDGELKQGPWTDIYALAGVVYFSLAGNAPPTAISRMLKDAMPRPRDAFVGRLPEHWLDAIGTALMVKPELRPQSISEFVALFGWDATAESMTTVVVPPVRSVSPPPATSPLVASIAPEEAVTTLVDDRTVVVALPRKPTPAVPVLAPAAPVVARAASVQVVAPSAPVDDESTVVIPRRAVDAQIAAKTPAPILPAVQPQPQTAPAAPVAAASVKSRSVVWIAVVAVLIALAALTWKLTSPPAVSPTAAPTVDTVTKPSAKPANDMSGDKKTSLPLPAPREPVQPDQPVGNAPETIVPAPVATPPAKAINTPQKTVTESPSASTSAFKAKAAANAKAAEKAKASRPAAASVDDGEDNPPARVSRRPARCEVLIERFQLGETPSAAEQRFFQESCK
jgi:serine/threonine protein kinase